MVSKLLNAGDGTNVGYDGTSFTSTLPINKTEFTVIARRRIKLEKVGGNPNYELDTSLGTSTISPSRYCTSFSQRIKLPQRLVYEQTSSQAPSNVFPFMMIGFCGADAMGGIAPISESSGSGTVASVLQRCLKVKTLQAPLRGEGG